jgi:hypothetical protein
MLCGSFALGVPLTGVMRDVKNLVALALVVEAPSAKVLVVEVLAVGALVAVALAVGALIVVAWPWRRCPRPVRGLSSLSGASSSLSSKGGRACDVVVG